MELLTLFYLLVLLALKLVGLYDTVMKIVELLG
jgi:hypothetical protein